MDMLSSLFSLLVNLSQKAWQSLRHRSLEKHVEPLRTTARSHPGLLAWRADPGSKEYRLYENLVRANLMVRSPWFPNHYMLPTRWH